MKRSRLAAKPPPEKEARRGVPKHLRVMISSRCNDPFPGESGPRLTDLRRAIKERLKGSEFLGWKPFEVWINEDEPPAPYDLSAFDLCLEEATRADIVIGLVNGNAGWPAGEGDVGICMRAQARFRRGSGQGADYRAARSRWLCTGRVLSEVARLAASVDQPCIDLRGGVNGAVNAPVDALVQLAVAGTRDVPRGRFYTGDALEWSRLDYEDGRKR